MPANQIPASAPRSAPDLHAGRDGFLSRRSDAEELLDRPNHDPAELAGNLRDIRTVNRVAGGVAIILRHLPGLACRVSRGRPVEILDLASGSGDIPSAILTWAKRNSRPIALTVSDLSPQVLDEARRVLGEVPEASFALYDAREVPLPDRAVDIVLCSLSLHHFAAPDAVRVLREMDRLSRAGFIVNDIRRSLSGYIAAWISSRAATRNRLTRHDMPLSVLRAYTPAELRALLNEAAIPDTTISTHPLFRMAAVQHKRDVPSHGRDIPR